MTNNKKKKEASVSVLQRIANALLDTKNKEALKLGKQLQGLKEGVEELPKEVFEALGAKFEKKAGELMPQSDNDLLERLEKIATQLEKQPVAPQGLAGVHSVQQIQDLAKELAELKQQTASLQTMQQDVQQVAGDVKTVSETINVVLQQSQQQVQYVQTAAKQSVEASNYVLEKVNGETAKIMTKLQEATNVTTSAANGLYQQIETKFAVTAQQQQQHDVWLQQFENKVSESLGNVSKLSEQRFTQLDESVEKFEDELEDMKKVLKTPIESIIGQMNMLKKELQQIQEVTAFLEDKAKQSLQFVEADEDEGYVTEAAELVRVLVDRLYVGAQLYAKHRETIEAIERGEQQKAQWEIEKQQYMNSSVQTNSLEKQLAEQKQEIENLRQELERQQKISENKEKKIPIKAIAFMAENLPIEEWPQELKQKVKQNGVELSDEWQVGKVVDVTRENRSTVEEYVELPNAGYETVKLTTSSYRHVDSDTVVQKAKSEIYSK